MSARAPPPPPAVAETSPFALVGTVLSSNARFAVLFDRTSNSVTRLREGQTEQGWTARKVERRTVLLEKDGAEDTLELPKSTDAPPPDAGAPTAEVDPQTRP